MAKFKKGEGGRPKGAKNKKRKGIHLNKKYNLLDEKWKNKPVVYFINCIGTSFYKVGLSKQVYGRLFDIDSANPHKIRLCEIFEFGNYKEVEKMLHESLSFFHVKGEWFSLTEEIEKAVCNIKDYNDLMKFKGKYSNTLF